MYVCVNSVVDRMPCCSSQCCAKQGGTQMRLSAFQFVRWIPNSGLPHLLGVFFAANLNACASIPPNRTNQIQDLTEQDLVNLRRTIYLTIMSSAGFEECAHKLAKMDIQEGYEMVYILVYVLASRVG